MISPRVRPSALATGTLVGVAFVLTLALYCVALHPGSIRQGGQREFILTIGSLLAYAGVAAWARKCRVDSVQVALTCGARAGLYLGVFGVLNMVLEHFAPLSERWAEVRGLGSWAVIFLSFGAAGSAAYAKTGALRFAALASLWCAIVGGTALIAFGFLLPVLFMPHMERVLTPAFTQSGMTSLPDFVIRNTLTAAAQHLCILPIVSAAFGLGGGIAAWLLASLRLNAVVWAGALEIVLLIGGVASVHFALSLARPERPPFIMTGALALGVALASAPAVLAAMRRPAPSLAT